MNTIIVPREWRRVAEEIKHGAKTGIILGRTDSGKSTLCKYLIQTWTASRVRVGYVDSDLGQSTIGFPTTVSLKIYDTPHHPRNDANPPYLQFVGNTAPDGFLVQTLHAVKMMADKFRQQGAEITLIDTAGFIDGPVARILKQHKIEMLRPQWILALQAGDEMEHLLKGYEKMGWQVIRLICSEHVAARSQAERQKYRSEKYKAYFKHARLTDCSLHRVVFPACILGTGERIDPSVLPNKLCIHAPNRPYLEKCGNELLIIADAADASIPVSPLKESFGVASVILIERDGLKDLLVGLNDDNNCTLGLGTIADTDPFAGKLTLFTPVEEIHKVTTIRLGVVKVERDGKEYGRTRVIRYC
ncbi:MAG: hypothetical protein B6D35_09260 [Candidatus Brocadia sp. UTAMX2]|jgi:polynucleotide 5'-kinase involved in rRNA processing|nr:MAG: hypothetical protein B6D35_09260 [Candidatus Brocadia sp. UTAMX2]